MSAQPIDTREDRGASFELTIRADSRLYGDGETYVLEVSVFALRGKMPVGEKLTSRIRVPTDEFKDEADAQTWGEAVFRSFRARSTAFLVHEAVQLVGDEAAAFLNERDEAAVNMAEVIELHTRATAEHLVKRFNLKKTGPAKQWSGEEFKAAVVAALRELPESERTYSTVAERLKETHGERAPEGPEAFRKMLRRFGLKWKDVRAGRVNLIENHGTNVLPEDV